MKKLYIVIIIMMCAHPLKSIMKENTIKTTISVLKRHAEDELAKVILFKHKSETSRNNEKKNELIEKAEESRYELGEIFDYIKSMQEYIDRNKKKYGVTYYRIYSQMIKNTLSDIQGFINHAEATLRGENMVNALILTNQEPFGVLAGSSTEIF